MSATKPPEKSMSNTLKDFYRNYLETNAPPKTRDEFIKLKQKSWSDSTIQLPKNSQSQSTVALQYVLKEKGFEIPDGIGKFKKSATVGSIEATFQGAGKKIEQAANQILGNPQTPNQQGFGIFKNNPNQPQPYNPISINQPHSFIEQRKILSEAEKASNKRFIKQTMQLPKNLWVQFGIIDSEDLTEQQKPKKWGDEVDEWAESLADWCNENGYSFPAKMEMILIGVTGISLFIFPLLMKIMGAKADKKKESKKKEPTKLDKILEKENLN